MAVQDQAISIADRVATIQRVITSTTVRETTVRQDLTQGKVPMGIPAVPAEQDTVVAEVPIRGSIAMADNND